MKIILRTISIFIAAAVIWTTLFVIRFFLFGLYPPFEGLSVMFRNAPVFTLHTVFGWLLSIILGPFASAQLWRLKHGGRIAAIILLVNAVLYYACGVVFYGADMSEVFVIATANVVTLIILSLPAAKKLCTRKQ